MNRYYLTTPIYYVNDKPHIGHAYTTVAADVLARYRRSLGEDVFFLTGVDEHGQKVEKAAALRGVSPQAHCDEMAPRFQALWTRLGIAHDAFLRTTDRAHKDYVREALARLHREGLIEPRDFEGWYCTPCERFWTEKDLGEGKACPDCGRPVDLLAERNYFFLMSRYAGAIRDALASGRLEILPVYRRNEVLGFLDRGLEDLCISRPRRRMGWGIPLPFDEEYVTYVWFDALLNYASGPRYLAAGGPERWPADVHLIGKDILTTHAVYWPAMLMALGLPLPRRIVAHGWWTFGGAKMSKSLGNVVDPGEVLSLYVPEGGERPSREALRWFLMAEVGFGNDGTFSLEALERRWTADLANDVGNLASRVVSLAHRVLGGDIPLVHDPSDDEAMAAYATAMDGLAFARAAEAIVGRARALNALLQARKPWENPPDAAEVLGRAASGLRAIAWMLSPFCPESARLLANALGLAESPGRPDAGIVERVRVGTLDPLFPRPPAIAARLASAQAGAGESKTGGKAGGVSVTKKEKAVMTQQGSGNMAAATTVAGPAEMPDSGDGGPPVVTIEDVKKLGLRVAVVTAAERVPKTERLLKLQVDLGTETRTLVAGLATAYAPEELVGRRVVVVANLQPATIRGIESRGMVLCAVDGAVTALLAPSSEVAAGSEVR